MGDGQTLSRRALVGAAIAVVMLLLPSMAWGQTPPPADRFQKVILDDTPGEPMNLAVLPDRRVLHTTRAGELRIYNPRTGLNTLAAMFDVYKHDEEGLQSIAVDPNFEDNHWVYVYYSPPLNTPVDDPSTPVTNEGDAPFTGTPADFAPFKGVIRLSRFKLVRSKLDMSSEQKIIDVPVDRGICCHVGGNIDFDSQGNLYLSTGDDTNPFYSDGYAPLDDSPGRNPAFDARRSAGNTNDLRGKLLRIRAKAGGGYYDPVGQPVPAGHGEDAARDLRDGPAQPVPLRGQPHERRRLPRRLLAGRPRRPIPIAGPAGQGRWMLITRARQLRLAVLRDARPAVRRLRLRDRDVRRGRSTATRRSTTRAYNTGLRTLPQVVAARRLVLVQRRQRCSRSWARAASARWAARRTTSTPSNRSAVPVADATTTACRCSTSGRATTSRSSASTGPTAAGSTRSGTCRSRAMVDNPMDMEFGPDGALYVLNYGDGYFAENPDAELSRIDFVRGNHTPVGQGGGDAQRRPCAADGRVLQRGHHRCRTATASRTRGTSTRTGRSTPPRPTRRTPTRRTACTTPRCG